MENRIEKLLYLVDKSGLGLEIGPSYNPVAPKKDGWNVKSFDHLNREQLIEKYRAWGVDTSLIEDVDYVSNEEGLFATVNNENIFDFIIASHVIEHMPDVVGFLQDCERMLKVGGLLTLAIPDKRYCFDTLKPCATTGQILQANLEKRKKHSAGTIFDAHALHVTNQGSLVWTAEDDEIDLHAVHGVNDAMNIMQQYIQADQFMDVHAWQFTPESFEELVSDLIEIGLLKMEIQVQFDTCSFEFFVSLRKVITPTVKPRDRLKNLLTINGNKSNPNTEKVTKLVKKRNGIYRLSGQCPICQKDTEFVSESEWFRDYLLCVGCLSVPRERAIMKLINEIAPNWRTLSIHESSPADRGASKKMKSECVNYVETQYDPSMKKTGEFHPIKHYRNEDLSNQTFADNSFDLVITQDVFEHIPNPALAIKEIGRTLKSGGFHIASVPLVRKWQKSITRAYLQKNGKYKYLYPAEYHGNPIDNEGSLVVTDWGYDIAAFFRENSDMDTMIYHIKDLEYGIDAEYIEIVVSRKE